MFVSKVRDNGERFVALADNAPGWLRDAVMEAHDGEFPNDWRFDTARAICDAILDGVDADRPDNVADALCDVYRMDLARWFAGNLDRAEYVDEFIRDYGWSAESGVFAAIAGGQYLCIVQMVNALRDAFNVAWMESEAHYSGMEPHEWWERGCPGPVDADAELGAS